MHPTSNNIGAYVKAVRGISPQDSAAATINGASIDRLGFDSCVLHHTCGAASGTPTSFTAASKLQDSDDGSTGWADLTGAAATTLAADDTEAQKDIDLTGAKRYIRVVETVAFVGGTSPKVEVAATVVLGGAVTKPV